jgi:hypothetical protein
MNCQNKTILSQKLGVIFKLNWDFFLLKLGLVFIQWINVLFTRQQIFCKNFFFKILCQKKILWRGRNITMVKIGTNRYKFTCIFCKIHVSIPPKKFLLKKKIFFAIVWKQNFYVWTPLKKMKVHEFSVY